MMASRVLNCFNAGDIKGSKESSGIGWHILNSCDEGYLSNLLNYGQIISTENQPTSAIADHISTNGFSGYSVGNLYALEGSAEKLSSKTNISGFKSDGEQLFVSWNTMQSDAFIRKLNENAKKLDSRCCGWTRGLDGFPILEIAEAHRLELQDIQSQTISSEETYYTLQGVRIDRPDKGVFIKVSRDGVKKVLIK